MCVKIKIVPTLNFPSPPPHTHTFPVHSIISFLVYVPLILPHPFNPSLCISPSSCLSPLPLLTLSVSPHSASVAASVIHPLSPFPPSLQYRLTPFLSLFLPCFTSRLLFPSHLSLSKPAVPPQFKEGEVNVTVTAGRAARLVCEARGDLPITAVWSNGEPPVTVSRGQRKVAGRSKLGFHHHKYKGTISYTKHISHFLCLVLFYFDIFLR